MSWLEPTQRPARPRFDPGRHEPELLAIIGKLRASPDTEHRLDAILRQHPRDGKALFSRAQIIAGFRHFAAREGWTHEEPSFVAALRKRRVRTLSGVAPVTVLTKPFPCPGRCIFCPNDVRMPKSYLAAEPGAQRATAHRFDPYCQTFARLQAFHEMGHATDKVELIVLGGTWSFYPEPYRIWFIKRCLDALCDFGASRDQRQGRGGPELAVAQRSATSLDFLDLERPRPEAVGGRYNEVVAQHLKRRLGGSLLAGDEQASWAELLAVQERNESAGCRCVGLSLETRPDHVSPAEVIALRRLGATKVQLGYQSLSDAVLAANQRGHDSAATRRAMRLLRGAGFKIHAHWMPNLYGSDPAADRIDFARIFDDPDFRPDELKIYPTSLIETAELMQHYRGGRWRPYADEELVALIADCMLRTPEYCRLTRVIRDISAFDIVVGNKTANLREVAERRLARRGLRPREIRSREVRDARFDPADLRVAEVAYRSGNGRERFLQVTSGELLLGFLRLSLPDEKSFIDELSHSALIREVHVYGEVSRLGERDALRPQHLGLGRRLVERAARLAREAGYRNLAVISALGTRAWYASLGFNRGELYQHLPLED